MLKRLAGAAALIGVLVLLVSLALNAEPHDRAHAITPTPAPWQNVVLLTVDVPQLVRSGEPFTVGALTYVQNQGMIDSVIIDGASYQAGASDPLDPRGDPIVELLSKSKVSVAGVTDSAEWTMRGLRPGRVSVGISHSYTTRACETCPAERRDGGSVRRLLEVASDPGDANCSAVADAIDAALIAQYLADLIDGLPCHRGADFDANGIVTIIDALFVLQHHAGLIGESSLLDNVPDFYP